MGGRMFTDAEFVERFWPQVDQNGNCWLWTGSRNNKGYGNFQARFAGQLFWKAHRFSWAIHNGPIPKGKMVCHTCNNRWCVNPEHLYVGTAYDNNHDTIKAGRNNFGERHGCSKLTEQDVMDIRASNETTVALGKKYGVHPATIGSARNGRKWKHLPLPTEHSND